MNISERTRNSKYRLLVIDDDPMILDLISEIMKPKGYRLDLCSSSGQALEMLIDYKYNLMLIDSKLPGITGPQLLKYCKEHHPATEVVLITGNPEVEEAVSSLKTGAFDYVAKPFSVRKLLETVEAALAKNEKTMAELLGDGVRGLDVAHIAESFPDYRIVRTLGIGSTGVVIELERDGCHYALKVLRPSSTWGTDQEAVKRFLREEKFLSRIHHPNVIRIIQSGSAAVGGYPYIMMEYVKGQVLTYYIKEKKMTLEQKIYIISQLASALSAVHKLGILHRDIKPGNVLVEDNFCVKLFDFGISALRDAGITHVGENEEVIGSPAYMAPEAFTHDFPIDNRTDIFSLGVLSYELITGIKPFQGQNVDAIIDAVCNNRPVEPSKLVPELPEGVQNLLEGMLRKNPQDRFASASEITARLNALGRKNGDGTIWTHLRSVIRSGKVWS
ncbi:MAG: protein kinase [Victivallales bacterium]|nr:protein kinase [Victivallales bacterium]